LTRPNRLTPRDGLALTLLLVPYLWLVQRYWFVCDDAFITFRYSKNLAQGFGPRYNIAKEVPVEGSSDFLWMVIAAVVEKAGQEPRLWMPAISAALGVLLVGWIYVFNRKHAGAGTVSAFAATLFVATFPPFAVWSTSGLETMPETLFLFGAFALLSTRDDELGVTLAGLCGLGLSLVRTEGIAWTVVIAALVSSARALHGRPWKRQLAVYATVLLLPFSAYYAWRTQYYHAWVANTALAKVHLEPVTFVRGLMYIALFITTLLSPLVVLWSVPTAWMKHRDKPSFGLAVSTSLMAVAIPAYAVTVSGDYMTWFRILVPAVPFVAVTLALAWSDWEDEGSAGVYRTVGLTAALATLSLLPAMDVHLVPESARESVAIREKLGFFRSENQQWEAMNEHVATWSEKGRAMAQYAKPGETYVAAAIGATGYYSGVYIYDRNGLVNREVAMQPWSGELRSPGHDKVVDRSFFFDKKPDILDSKVLGGPRMKTQINEALREMEAAEVKSTYYPDLLKVNVQPANGPRPRYLFALRRAESPEDAAAHWAAFTEEHGLRTPDDEDEPKGKGKRSDDKAAEPAGAGE